MDASKLNPHSAAFRFGVLLALLAASLCLAGCHHRTEQATGDAEGATSEGDSSNASVTVKTMPAERKTLSELVYGLGTCEALLDKCAIIAPAFEGQVSEILVKHGASVKAGQPIVRLNSKLAEANLQEKNTTFEGLKASLKLLQALPRPEEQKAYRLAIDDAKVALQKSEAVVERLRSLRERGDIPQQQLFEAELAVRQSQLALQKAESQFNVAMLGPRSEAVEEAQVHIATAEAGVAAAQRQFDLLTLRSPIDGVIDRISCKLGQTLSGGTPVAEIVDAHQLEVLAWLPAFDAVRVQLGQTVEVVSGDAPRGKDETVAEKIVSGKVSFVGRVVDPQTGSLPIRVSIDNSQDRFALGQTVTAAIAVREKADALAVPTTALDDLGEGPRLNVVRAGKSVVLHPHIGIKAKDWVEIEGTDLKDGESVIVEGGYNLPEGTRITSLPAHTNSAESAAGAEK